MIAPIAIGILSIVTICVLFLSGSAFEAEEDRVALLLGVGGIAAFLSVIGLLVL